MSSKSLTNPFAMAIEYLNAEQAFFGIKVQIASNEYIDSEYLDEKLYKSFWLIGTFLSLAFFKSLIPLIFYLKYLQILVETLLIGFQVIL